ncbi:MAG: VIT1/CCC1 transporter family protein [Pseudomonadota bacterium]
MSRRELHRSQRVGWLRAAVLGANDGIVSTASLIIGVAASGAGQAAILVAGTASLVAGAMSMAAGEYVSVSSQADTEAADLALERESLRTDHDYELRELAGIYEARGLQPELARQVAEQLMAGDALAAHARDELGITDTGKPRPVQAALYSAAAFTSGAALPLTSTWLVPRESVMPAVALLSLVFLGVLGGLAARTGGAPVWKGAARVTFWGAMAMVATAAVGQLFGSPVA